MLSEDVWNSWCHARAMIGQYAMYNIVSRAMIGQYAMYNIVS